MLPLALCRNEDNARDGINYNKPNRSDFASIFLCLCAIDQASELAYLSHY